MWLSLASSQKTSDQKFAATSEQFLLIRPTLALRFF